MPRMHSKRTGFTYSGLFIYSKERTQNLKKQEIR